MTGNRPPSVLYTLTLQPASLRSREAWVAPYAVAEVLEHFTSLVGCEVEVTLEIQATYPAGFEDGTVRTVGRTAAR